MSKMDEFIGLLSAFPGAWVASRRQPGSLPHGFRGYHNKLTHCPLTAANFVAQQRGTIPHPIHWGVDRWAEAGLDIGLTPKEVQLVFNAVEIRTPGKYDVDLAIRIARVCGFKV